MRFLVNLSMLLVIIFVKKYIYYFQNYRIKMEKFTCYKNWNVCSDFTKEGTYLFHCVEKSDIIYELLGRKILYLFKSIMFVSSWFLEKSINILNFQIWWFLNQWVIFLVALAQMMSVLQKTLRFLITWSWQWKVFTFESSKFYYIFYYNFWMQRSWYFDDLYWL